MIWTGALKTNRKGIYAMAAISRRGTRQSVSFSIKKIVTILDRGSFLFKYENFKGRKGLIL